MRRASGVIIISLVVLAFSQVAVLSQTRERAEVPAEHTWRLEDLYASDEAWNESKQKLAAQFSQITKYKGQLTTSASRRTATRSAGINPRQCRGYPARQGRANERRPASRLACLSFNSEISKELRRLPGDRGQRTEDRRQRTEDRRQETEDRGQILLCGTALRCEERETEDRRRQSVLRSLSSVIRPRRPTTATTLRSNVSLRSTSPTHRSLSRKSPEWIKTKSMHLSLKSLG